MLDCGTAKRVDEERHVRVDGPHPGVDCDQVGESPVEHYGEVLPSRVEPEKKGRRLSAAALIVVVIATSAPVVALRPRRPGLSHS